MKDYVKDCLKKNTGIIFCGLAAILLIHASLLFPMIFPAEYTPEEGVWYCEELAIQLSYDESCESYIVIDGEKIICDHGTDRGSSLLMVGSQDPQTERFYLGETVFSGYIVHLDTETYVIQEDLTKIEYTFTRVG